MMLQIALLNLILDVDPIRVSNEIEITKYKVRECFYDINIKKAWKS